METVYIGNCSKSLRGGRWIFTNHSTRSTCTLSARDDITSLERVAAHWRSFLCYQLEGLFLKDLNSKDLISGIRNAKKTALRRDGADFCDGSGQLQAVDSTGESIKGGPVEFFDGFPSIKAIKSLFEEYPNATTLAVEGQTRWLGEYGNITTRREESTACDWWVFTIVR